MLLPRRTFLRHSLVFGAAAVLFSENARLGLARTLGVGDDRLSDVVLRDPIYSFTRETFEPYVGGYFEAPGTRGQMVALKLLKVDSYAPDPDTKISTRSAVETKSFSLLFNAEEALPRVKGTHHIKHGALGEFDLFLTRRDSPNGEIFYEAVFNHVG